MLKDMKKKDKKIVLILIILSVVSLLLTYSVNSNRKINKSEIILKQITTSIKELFINDDLKKFNKINNLIKINENEEIKELKKLLELKDIYSNYSLINAAVILRNKNYYLSTLEIDIGSKDGIKKNMAVITSEGLIGKISKVYKNSSEVKLISKSGDKYKTSIIIKAKEKDYVGIIDGIKGSLIEIKDISKDSNIEIGDEIITSGMEEEIPRGIYIGKVKKIEKDKYDLSKRIYIETSVDFNKIHYVSVVGDKNE